MTCSALPRRCLCLLTAALTLPAAGVDYQWGVSLDDNPMFSRSTTLDRPVATLTASLFDSEFHERSQSTGYSIENAVDVEIMETTPSLSSVSAEVGFTRYWQPRPGYNTPWYQLALTSGPQLVANPQRTRLNFNGQLSRHQRLTDRISVESGLLGQYSFAPEQVMRQARWGVEGQVGYERRLAGLRGWRGLYLHGQVLSGQFGSARSYNPGAVADNEKIQDKGLRDDLEGYWWLYRTTGQAYSLTLNLRYQWSSRTAVDLFTQLDRFSGDVADYGRLSSGLTFSSRLIDRAPGQGRHYR